MRLFFIFFFAEGLRDKEPFEELSNDAILDVSRLTPLFSRHGTGGLLDQYPSVYLLGTTYPRGVGSLDHDFASHSLFCSPFFFLHFAAGRTGRLRNRSRALSRDKPPLHTAARAAAAVPARRLPLSVVLPPTCLVGPSSTSPSKPFSTFHSKLL